jgi:tRNA A37 N6-isopentenylltransferase MiaA
MAVYHEQEKAEGEAKEKLSEATTLIQKARTEMEEEEPPDPARLHRWLETAKYSIKAFGLTKEVADAAKAAWDAFGMSS